MERKVDEESDFWKSCILYSIENSMRKFVREMAFYIDVKVLAFWNNSHGSFWHFMVSNWWIWYISLGYVELDSDFLNNIPG
jgi:hypothetical protein